jgi:indoleamine 2,3-dioxygenase
MDFDFATRGFLPASDPLTSFPADSEFAVLDEIGRDVPSLLHDSRFRDRARQWTIPDWKLPADAAQQLPQLRLYYVRTGFLASAYINQVGQPTATVLPANLARPLCRVCQLLGRPPILSYDGYALYNWKRFDRSQPIALGNIDTIQNFVHLYDEHWFILIHVEIEAIAAQIFEAINRIREAMPQRDEDRLNLGLAQIADAVWRQGAVLRRIPEKMDPALYYKTFRPYIRFFENVIYEGIDAKPMDYRGETGAQSSIMPTLVALMKIPHHPTLLTNHLADMQRFMPVEHRQVIEDVRALPSFRDWADKAVFNDILEAMALFRETHYGWAQEYINARVADARGTGGTPYMQWLAQLIAETRAHKIA